MNNPLPGYIRDSSGKDWPIQGFSADSRFEKDQLVVVVQTAHKDHSALMGPYNAPKPTFKMYSIWVEGYAATGESGCCWCAGRREGRDFDEACARLAMSDGTFYRHWDPVNKTWWGCRVFPSFTLASQSFG